jgi:hypothetical protein
VCGDSWQARVKALVCVEKLVKTTGCEAHRDWWLDYCDEVDEEVFAQNQHLTSLCMQIGAYQDDQKASVREKAVRVLRALGVASEEHALSAHVCRLLLAVDKTHAFRVQDAAPAKSPSTSTAQRDLLGDFDAREQVTFCFVRSDRQSKNNKLMCRTLLRSQILLLQP